MSIASNDKLALLAIKIAHEVYTGGCIGCGADGVEMHEVLGRQMRSILGSSVAILGATLAPLCQKCHREFERFNTGEQLFILGNRFAENETLRKAQIDQLVALKARCAVCK